MNVVTADNERTSYTRGLHEQSRPYSANNGFSHPQQLLAAIVESSDDAIITKNIDGTITSWNKGAQHLFGYTAAEIIGRSINLLIPHDRRDEEKGILARIQEGQRVDHFETVRRRKDGTLVPISVTISPIRDENGIIVSASKIARDISERRRIEEHQQVLFAEMQHRIKNIFALAESLVSVCMRQTNTAEELADMVRSRLHALASAHAQTVSAFGQDANEGIHLTTVTALLRTLLEPYAIAGIDRMQFTGDDLTLSMKALTPVALVLNELVTNAAKHGALAKVDGSVHIDAKLDDQFYILEWQEHRHEAVSETPIILGFGTRLSEVTARAQLGGDIERTWSKEGLHVRISMSRRLVEGHSTDQAKILF